MFLTYNSEMWWHGTVYFKCIIIYDYVTTILEWELCKFDNQKSTGWYLPINSFLNQFSYTCNWLVDLDHCLEGNLERFAINLLKFLQPKYLTWHYKQSNSPKFVTKCVFVVNSPKFVPTKVFLCVATNVQPLQDFLTNSN